MDQRLGSNSTTSTSSNIQSLQKKEKKSEEILNELYKSKISTAPGYSLPKPAYKPIIPSYQKATTSSDSSTSFQPKKLSNNTGCIIVIIMAVFGGIIVSAVTNYISGFIVGHL